MPSPTELSTSTSSFAPIGYADVDTGIVQSARHLPEHAGLVLAYCLPDNAGIVYHIEPTSLVMAGKMFEAYQLAAARTAVPLFERKPLNNVCPLYILHPRDEQLTVQHMSKGQLLAQHFALNSGAAYKYAVASQSLSFDDSPRCVTEARDHIIELTEQAIGQHVDFNEVLSVLYREGQRMSWHDDGEPGLGPVVASLSLGAQATMSFRPKGARVNPNARFRQGSHDEAEGEGKNGGGGGGARPETVLEITLSHGDVVVMQGREIQQRYVHRVVPHGMRIAATARHIAVLPSRLCPA